MADTVLANMLSQSQPIRSANEWVKKYFPVAQNYSIVNDLSFLAMPASEMVIEPIVRNGIERLGVKDEDIPKYAAGIVDAALEKVAQNGSITLFGTIELEDADRVTGPGGIPGPPVPGKPPSPDGGFFFDRTGRL